MKLNIHNEFAPLKHVVVCWGHGIPDFEVYRNKEPEFTKYHHREWNKRVLLQEQVGFLNKLIEYGVTPHFLKTSEQLTQQIYTRDTAFVVRDKIYFSRIRQFSDRIGEVEALLDLLEELKVDPKDILEIKSGSIEGGDVVVNDGQAYVGNGSRTTSAAIDELHSHVPGKKFFLGDHVMHMDTRFTILPREYALIYPAAFQAEDLDQLKKQFKFIPVLKKELEDLGTNVFFLNPETLLTAKHNVRINDELRKAGFNVEEVEYTEPINLGGSFRCTTMPLVRE